MSQLPVHQVLVLVDVLSTGLSDIELPSTILTGGVYDSAALADAVTELPSLPTKPPVSADNINVPPSTRVGPL